MEKTKKVVSSQLYFPYLSPLLWGKLFDIFFILVLMITCITLESILSSSLLINQIWTVYDYILIYV